MNEEAPTWESSTAVEDAPRWEDSTPADEPHWDDSTPVGTPPSETPHTDNALMAFAKKPSPQWLQNPEQAVKELVSGMAPHDAISYLSSIFPAASAAKQMADIVTGLAHGDVSGVPLVGRVPEIAAAEQTPAGSKERYLTAMKTLMDLGLLAGAGERPSMLRGEPLAPEPPPTVSGGAGTTAADVTAAMQGPAWERRFTMQETPPEAPPELSAAPSLEELLQRTAPRISPETGFTHFPSEPPSTEPRPIQTETARIGGDSASQITSPESVSQPEVRTRVGEETPLRQQGETTPAQEPVSPGESVAPTAQAEPNAPEVAPQPITAELPTKGGPSIRAVSERPIEAPPPGSIRGWEEATAHGENWLNHGGDINKVVTDFRKTGKVNELEMGKMNAYLNRLQSATNQAGDAFKASPTPKLQQAYQQAVAAEQAFSEAYKPMHTVASGSLAALQGHVPLTNEAAASYTGLQRRFSEFHGEKMSPEEAVKADKLSKKATKDNKGYEKATKDLYDTIDTEYKRIRTTRKSPPTLKDIGEIFGKGLDVVCDV